MKKNGYRLNYDIIFILCMVLLVSFIYSSPTSAQTLVLYDDFNKPYVDPSKWIGVEYNDNNIMTELTRSISGTDANRWLNLRLVAHSIKSLTAMTIIPGNKLRFANAEALTAMKAKATIKSAEVTNCTSNIAYPNFVRFRMAGYFFNCGKAAPGSRVNDIYAQMRIVSSANNPSALSAVAIVDKCLDDTCDSYDRLLSQPLVSVEMNKPITVGINWSKSGNAFVFTAGAKTHKYVYTLSDAYPAWASNDKRIEVQAGLNNCVDNSTAMGMIEATVDNVYTNAAALP
ncbi:MAG: hypothetical protein ACLGPL_07790 [Acidobacteriota bacterium]